MIVAATTLVISFFLCQLMLRNIMITVPTFDYFGVEVQVVREKIDYVIQVDEYGN